MEIPFVGLHHLLQNKRASGRPEDLMDVKRLEPALRRLEAPVGQGEPPPGSGGKRKGR